MGHTVLPQPKRHSAKDADDCPAHSTQKETDARFSDIPAKGWWQAPAGGGLPRPSPGPATQSLPGQQLGKV